MILENGIVKYLTVEDNAQKTSCTMAGHVLEALGKCFRKSQCATLFCLSYYDPMPPALDKDLTKRLFKSYFLGAIKFRIWVIINQKHH